MVAGDVQVVVFGDGQKIEPGDVACVIIGLGRAAAAGTQRDVAVEVAEEDGEPRVGLRPRERQAAERENGGKGKGFWCECASWSSPRCCKFAGNGR